MSRALGSEVMITVIKMAAVCVCVVLPLLLVLQTVSVCRGVPVVTDVQLSVEGDMRNIIVAYEAEKRPVVLWKILEFVNFDNTTHTFLGTKGEATLHMYIDPQRRDSKREIQTCIYGEDYEINLFFREGDIRNSRLERNTIRPLVFRSQPDGLVNFAENEHVNFSLSLESQNLGSFEMDFTVGILTSFDYRSIPPVETRLLAVPYLLEHWFDSRRNSFVLPPLNITSVSTLESTVASIDTTYPYTEGEAKFAVGLNVSSAYSLLDSIVIRRWVYLKNRGHVSPFRNSVNVVGDPQNRHSNEAIHARWPYTQVDALGYPKPVLKLFRGCREITELEVETFTIGTAFRSRTIFRFKNVTEALEGAYYVSASSGDNEVSKMYYIEVW